MNLAAFILKTMRHFWQTNLAVLLGVAIGTAVIAGALIVGDSVRFSLRQMTLDRLGRVDLALSGQQFFRQNLAEELQQLGSFEEKSSGLKEGGYPFLVAPTLMLTGSFQRTGAASAADLAAGDTPQEITRIAGRVNLIAGDQRLWELLEESALPLPEAGEVVLNSRLAEQLQADVGDRLTLFVDLPQTIPQESLLGKRDVDERVVEVNVMVSGILPAESTASRFSLQPNQQLPLNAYLSLEHLQSELDLAEVQASPRNPFAKPARVNGLLIADPLMAGEMMLPILEQPGRWWWPQSGGTLSPSAITGITTRVNARIKPYWQLSDLFLHTRDFPERDFFSIESDRMMLDRATSHTAQISAADLTLPESDVLVYLVNEIHSVKDPSKYSMYSVAAGLDFPAQGPFGPFVNREEQPVVPLKKNEVALNDWLAEDLQVDVGDEIVIKYHVVGSRGELPEIEKTFRVASILKLAGTPAADPALTPHVEGITDARTLADWEQPFPMQMERITLRDDEYWVLHKTTPKLFVSLEQARDLWQSRYGDTTSIRIGTANGQTLEQARQEWEEVFLRRMPYFQLGLTALPVKFQGLAAAQGTQDFTGLFIAFSFFVIAAAMMLIALLFQLGIENRMQQIGLLESIGFSRATIRHLLLGEGLLIALLGTALGAWLAVLYARLMIHGLTTWWRGAIGTSYLEVSVVPGSLLLGCVIALGVSFPGMLLGIRSALKLSPRARMLGGRVEQRQSTAAPGWTCKSVFGAICLVTAGCLLAGVQLQIIPSSEAFSGFNWHVVSFFLSGFLLLTGSLLLYVVRLRHFKGRVISASGAMAAWELGQRNIGRNRQRSGVTVTLIALASFVVMAVAAGRQNPTQLAPSRASGNGGFSLLAESARPLLYDLTTPSGQNQLGLIGRQDERLRQLLVEAEVIAFRVRPGEDASCLNLYQTRLPTILGVPEAMIERGGFVFADTAGSNPWELLRGETAQGNIPVLGDQNTLQYSLHKAIGNLIDAPQELQLAQQMEVVGSLSGSVFQGVLLMSEENLLKLFPEVSGYAYFLFDTPLATAEELTGLLESRMVSFGLDVEPVSERLENFLAVQNTYLSTFQALGGMGLLLGTIGMGTVMLRNVLERRAELALMRAIGFGKIGIGLLVLAENAVLLAVGLIIGTVCALLAMTPNMTSYGGAVPWSSILSMLLGVFVVGMLASILAVMEAVRTPVLETLRSE